MENVTKITLLLVFLMHFKNTQPQFISVDIDTSRVIHTTSRSYIGVAIDSGVLRRNWGKFNPRSQKVLTLASALTPCYLRVGGTDADFLIFDDGSGNKRGTDTLTWNSKDAALRVLPEVQQYTNPRSGSRLRRDVGLDRDHTNFTMSGQLYDELHKFVSSVGFDLIFDLNVLLRRGESWDPDNAIKLINYTIAHGYKMAGWELGNEPDDYLVFTGKTYIPSAQLVKDFHSLVTLIERSTVYRDHLVLGPSVAQLSAVKRIAYFNSFLTNGGKDVVTAATFHQYYVNGRTATLDDFIDPEVLNLLYDEVQMGVNLTRESGSKAKPWIGETSSAWGGGAEGLSDRYVAAFMWLDKLGISAAWGIDVVIRQAFYGGHYALIDQYTLDPNPDYWLTLMYKILVGNRVLRVLSPSSRDTLRVYAHCVNTERSGYQSGSVVFYIMNLGTSQKLTFSNFQSTSTVHMYTFTPEGGDLTSQSVLLNGQLLQMVDEKTLPDLLIPIKGTAPVYIEAHTYSFVVFPDVNLDVCK